MHGFEVNFMLLGLTTTNLEDSELVLLCLFSRTNVRIVQQKKNNTCCGTGQLTIALCAALLMQHAWC